jgi:hypothetical protein
MQRNIIFVATNDPVFEKAAMDVILGSRHGMRKTGDSKDVWRLLTLDDTTAVALAIIDVEFDDCGVFLLHVLCNSEPGFPILAVTSNPSGLFTGTYNTDGSIHCMSKPVSAGELQAQILELCDGKNTGYPARGRGRLEMVSRG